MEVRDYWGQKNLLNEIKKKYQEQNYWDEEKATKYLQEKLKSIAGKYNKNGGKGSITWVKKHDMALNRKHNRAIEKINQSFKDKDMTMLYKGIAELENVVDEIISTTKRAKENLIELAMTKTANEWKKQKDNSTNDSQRIYYNALQRLREAIDKNHKNDISGWEFVVSELRRINYR